MYVVVTYFMKHETADGIKPGKSHLSITTLYYINTEVNILVTTKVMCRLYCLDVIPSWYTEAIRLTVGIEITFLCFVIFYIQCL